MNLELFKAQLFAYNPIGSKDDREGLIKDILDLKGNHETTNNSNNKCWRYENFPIKDWLKNELDIYLNEVYNFYSDDDMFITSNRSSYKFFCWANVNEPGSRNTLHSHKKAHLSMIYYLQAAGTGNLRICNPANILGDCNFSAPYVRDFEIEPKDGDLFIWPAWLPHEVETNLSDKQRINLVFDVIFDKDE